MKHIKSAFKWIIIFIFTVIYAVVGILWFLFSIIPCLAIEVSEMVLEKCDSPIDKDKQS